jgi:hypothetical protein
MGEEKPSKADKKKEAAAAAPAEQPIVLKVDLHCAGCASKVKRAIKHAPGMSCACALPRSFLCPTLRFVCLFLFL